MYVHKKLSKSEIVMKIYSLLMSHRRVPASNPGSLCSSASCEKCKSQYLPNIVKAVEAHMPIKFVLPAFPGKSPNHEKVLGHLPDYGEELALVFLNNLCENINMHYQPGAEIIICSDGRVFSDVIGMKEVHVTEYQNKINQMIESLNLNNLSVFNLDEIYADNRDMSFNEMRQKLMSTYGESLEVLKQRVRNGDDNAESKANLDEVEANRMYKGMVRFLFEDGNYTKNILQLSRTAIQKKARIKAYEVILRSNAWSNLIAEIFPEAVRLSIHPQSCGAKKLGIKLIGNESWMTPWHGVAVESEHGFKLLKRSEAESLGAELVYDSNNMPNYYSMLNSRNLEKNNKARRLA